MTQPDARRPQLSLDCLSLTDTAPADLIHAAGEAGFDCVSLWLQPPSVYPAMQVTAENARECERRLADTGMRVHSLEAFDIASEEAIEEYRPAMELGARLGGKMALAYHLTVEDRSRAADLLAHFAETAAQFGLGTLIEPIIMAQTGTLAQARELIRASGADTRILFDTWHFMRNGCSVDDLRAIEPELIGYVQINDGLLTAPEDPIAEVTGERRYLGTGEFPLVELLSLVRRDVPWGNETPSLGRARAGVGATGQAREIKAAMEGLLGRLEP